MKEDPTAIGTSPLESGTAMTRRTILGLLGAAPAGYLAAKLPPSPSVETTAALREDILDSPLTIGLHRAEVFTRVFRENEDQPWIRRKALALREYLETVPLYLREGDGLAGSISERPGAMPVFVELGIGENGIYTGERPDRKGHLEGQVPAEIREYWKNRNAFGLFRTEIQGLKPFQSADEVPQTLSYKFISNQGHLCPSYAELLEVGLQGLQRRVADRCAGETDTEKAAFLLAAGDVLAGVSNWIERYGLFLAQQAKACGVAARRYQLTWRSWPSQ
jgi:hypothetical protein